MTNVKTTIPTIITHVLPTILGIRLHHKTALIPHFSAMKLNGIVTMKSEGKKYQPTWLLPQHQSRQAHTTHNTHCLHAALQPRKPPLNIADLTQHLRYRTIWLNHRYIVLFIVFLTQSDFYYSVEWQCVENRGELD
jgi:hypothetical protein